jgi:DNA integrity scanning protein DisA with diadenylate cyclase activity
LVFKILEKSEIKVKTIDYESKHQELGDAMEKAINWLASQPVGTEVIITEKTIIIRTA